MDSTQCDRDLLDISKSIRYGRYRSVGGGNQDGENMSLFHSHEREGLKNIASFGLFDEHKGTLAADICAKELHYNVIDNFVRLSTNILKRELDLLPGYECLSRQDRVDSIICESIKRACLNVDDHIRTVGDDDSGSCAISLFMLRNEDGFTRIVCANVGDSRCVLYGKTFEFVRVLPFKGADVPKEVSRRKYNAFHSYQMSEDHKVSLLRERSRVMGKIRLSDRAWLTRPITVFVPLPASLMIYEHGLQGGVCPTFELGYPSRDRISAAESMMSSVGDCIEGPFTPRHCEGDFVNHVLSNATTVYSDDDNIGKDLNITTNFSIASSLGTKLRTTRSIGDKFGPDGLISIPEMSAVTLTPSESGRFILANRCLWDNVSDEEVMTIAKKFASPGEAAKSLGALAESRMILRSAKEGAVSLIIVDILRSEVRDSYCVIS